MTMSNIVERFMEELDANPALLEAVRARLLTRELLELPERYEQFTEMTKLRLEALESAQVEANQRLSSLESTLQRFMETTQQRFDGIDQRFDGIDQRFDGIDQRFDGIDQRFDGVDQRFDTLEGQMDSMRGDHLEMRVQGRIYGLLGSGDRDFRGTRLLKARFPGGLDPVFQSRVDSAEFDGLITAEQYGRLLDTDLIASARRRDSPDQMVYIAMEVANRLNAGDIERVVDTGVALALVFPHSEILTLVYGRSISQVNEALAARNGVDVILTSDSR